MSLSLDMDMNGSDFLQTVRSDPVYQARETTHSSHVIRLVKHRLLGEVTRTKDGRSKNLTRTRNVPPECNKQVTSKQQTRSFLTSNN
jgi:hypothetical protein